MMTMHGFTSVRARRWKTAIALFGMASLGHMAQPALAAQTSPAGYSLPTLQEALAAKTDVWGERAMREPGGPSYEFFARLLPPLRYVNAEFRHYPIVLSAPFAPAKARLTSNGSAINAAANLGTWREVGLPVAFFVGPEQHPFGERLERLRGPHYARGYLPVVELSYEHGGAHYSQEVFASVDPAGSAHGAVWVRLGLAAGQSGQVTAVLKSGQKLHAGTGAVRDEAGRTLLGYDSGWTWDADRNALSRPLAQDGAGTLLVFTSPVQPEATAEGAIIDVTPEAFTRHRQACENAWDQLLARATRLETPEPVVDRAWRSLLVGTLMIASQDAMNYSAGNAYARMYAEESSSPVHALLFFGLTDEARRLMGPLLGFDRQPELGFHNAAFQLQLLVRYYWLTRDTDFMRRSRPVWQPHVDRIIAGLEPATGLLPKENYCGDIATKVHSLNSNANCWRALRDMAAVLRDAGDPNRSLEERAADYRRAILQAVAKSEDRSVDPPFIPVALFGAEKPYETLTATMQGSYWNLMSNYLLRSGLFRAQPEKARWISDFLQCRGGVCMGMLRFDQHSGLFANTSAVDDLYSLGYILHMLEQDDAERVLVSFYGKLAHGLTRDTFIGAEGTGLTPLDEHGRAMYLPPNAASNALFLWTLRHMLAQDWDADDDGSPDTLRLLFATPPRWLEDGLAIRAAGVPTAFGKVSFDVQSRLSAGHVVAELTLPAPPAKRTLFRLRLPRGWRIKSATGGGASFVFDEKGTVDLSGWAGSISIRFEVREE